MRAASQLYATTSRTRTLSNMSCGFKAIRMASAKASKSDLLSLASRGGGPKSEFKSPLPQMEVAGPRLPARRIFAGVVSFRLRATTIPLRAKPARTIAKARRLRKRRPLRRNRVGFVLPNPEERLGSGLAVEPDP